MGMNLTNDPYQWSYTSCMLSWCPQGHRNGLRCVLTSHSFVMSVCSSAGCMSAAATGQIFMIFETRD